MKFRVIGMAAAVASTLVMAGAAMAQPEVGWMHGHMGGGGMEFMHGLNLTDAQKSEAKAIEKSTWESMRPLMEKMRAAHEAEINAFLGTGSVTAATLQPMVAQEEALREQMDAIRLNAMIQMRGLLSADQLATAAARHTQLEALHAQEHAVMTGEAPQ